MVQLARDLMMGSHFGDNQSDWQEFEAGDVPRAIPDLVHTHTDAHTHALLAYP